MKAVLRTLAAVLGWVIRRSSVFIQKSDQRRSRVCQLLRAADGRAVNDVLYNGDRRQRDLAEDVFERLNRAGD